MTETVAAPSPHARGTRTPVHLWIVGIVSLLWNAMGAFDYLATQMRLESYMSQFTEEQLAYWYGFPAWVVSAWAIAVWGAFFGSIALLLRKSWSVWLFGLSILGMVVTSIYTFGLSEGASMMGTGEVIFSAIIWIVAIALFVYSRRQAANGVLR